MFMMKIEDEMTENLVRGWNLVNALIYFVGHTTDICSFPKIHCQLCYMTIEFFCCCFIRLLSYLTTIVFNILLP